MEGKVQDLQKKYNLEDYEEDYKKIVELDPSPTKKYLEWMIKQYVNNTWKKLSRPVPLSFFADLGSSIKYFHENIQRFPNKDINSYTNLKHLENTVKEIGSKPSRNASKESLEGKAKKLFEDDDVLLVRPDDKETVMKYGAGTRWCITMRDADYYEEYSTRNILFYFLIHKKYSTADENMAKVAFAIYRKEEDNKVYNEEIFDAEDKSLSVDLIFYYDQSSIELTSKKLDTLVSMIKSDAETQPATFLARLSSGNVTENEILPYWKSKFDKNTGHVGGRGKSYNLSQEKIGILKKCSIAIQKKIAKIDDSVASMLKSGHYVCNDNGGIAFPGDIVAPGTQTPVFQRISDKKIFYSINRINKNQTYKVEAPSDGEICFVNRPKNGDFEMINYDSVGKNGITENDVGKIIYFDNNGKEFVELDTMVAKDEEVIGMSDSEPDPETGEITVTYPSLI